MKRHPFTLVELLVVIAIIAILAGIAIPATGSAIKKARITQARSEISSLMMAIKNFEGTYSVLPVLAVGGANATNTADLKWTDVRDTTDKALAEPENSVNYNKADSKAYDALVQLLAGRDMTANTGTEKEWTDRKAKDVKGRALNLRNQVFLDVPQFFDTKGFCDPWGTRYAVLLDADYDGKIKDFPENGKNLIGSAFVYSYGPNRLNDNGFNKANGGTPAQDDITSWDVQ